MSGDGDGLLSLLAEARGPVVVSRAVGPSLWSVLSSLGREDVDVRPTVRGATVWGDVADAVVVVEHPNWFGRPDWTPSGRVMVVVHDDDVTFPAVTRDHRFIRNDRGPGIATFGPAPIVPDPDRQQRHAAATTKARRLALLAGQVPGFRLAHGKPGSPVFVAMFPVDPHRVTSALAGSGNISAEPVGARFPELPGGVRVRVGAAASEGAIRKWVDAADRIVRSEERLEP